MILYTITVVLATILALFLVLIIIAMIKKHNEEKRKQENFKREVDRLTLAIRHAYNSQQNNSKGERKNE